MSDENDNNEELLGDKIERNLKRVGADRAADTYQHVTGRDCGCKKRKRQLNRIHESYRERRRRMIEQRAAQRQNQDQQDS